MTEFLAGYQRLVDEVAETAKARGLEPLPPEQAVALEAFSENLMNAAEVTAVQGVGFPGGILYVVVTHAAESTITSISRQGFESYFLVKQARWSNSDIECAQRLVHDLNDLEVVELGGGVSENGDYAITVTLREENLQFREQIAALPSGLVSVRVQ